MLSRPQIRSPDWGTRPQHHRGRSRVRHPGHQPPRRSSASPGPPELPDPPSSVSSPVLLRSFVASLSGGYTLLHRLSVSRSNDGSYFLITGLSLSSIPYKSTVKVTAMHIIYSTLKSRQTN